MNKYTIVRPWQSEMIIEKSRFICQLQKARTETEAQAYIKTLKKKYWDANHNCSAYIIGKDGGIQRSNDDGEPSGTAGIPMLEVLRKKQIFNTVAVVTRYFGGVKLGAGGLIRAYTCSVAEALSEAGLAEVISMGRYSFEWEIKAVGKVLNLLYQQQLFQVGTVEYAACAKINLTLKAADKKAAEKWLTQQLSKTIELQEEERYEEELATEEKKTSPVRL